jgi:PPK2 family polyphosphate:nucleotide phosphotransferase
VLDALRIAPKTSPDLASRATSSVPGVDLTKKTAAALVADRKERLEVLQQRLFAENARSLLVVMQGMDTSGKDGAIKNVFGGITPAATQVATFKVPTEVELAHDFLWRVHQVCPSRGRIGIFNRSHYEDVVAVRVRHLAPRPVIRRRYRAINDFERLLDDEGTTVVKLFLHLSKEEQKVRLQARLEDPEKRWKFRVGDLDDRDRWTDFDDAYEDAIAATSTAAAPWFVVPADKKWLRDAVVADVVVSALERMDPKLPPDDPALATVVVT